MMPTSIEEYMRRLRMALLAEGVTDFSLADEILDHLTDAVDAAVGDGRSRADAERDAITRLGAPAVVAAALAAQHPPVVRRLLGIVCAGTILAVVTLTVSLLSFHPPHARYSAWFTLATIFVMQSAATLLLLPRLGTASIGSGVLLGTGAIVTMLLASASAIGGAHFEGYAVVLAVLVTAQGVFTLVQLLRRVTASARRHHWT